MEDTKSKEVENIVEKGEKSPEIDYKALYEKAVKDYDDLLAEKDSFKTENETLKQDKISVLEELKKTKETNFLLARHVSAQENQKDIETLMYEMFSK